MPTIMIADDSLFQRAMLGKTAREAGFTVIEANSGQECLDLVRRQIPDALLLDLNMPEVNGIEVLRTLQAEGRDARAIVISADIQETTKKLCLEAGARVFLTKPVKEEDLLQCLRDMIQ